MMIPESAISIGSDEHHILEHYLMCSSRTSRLRVVNAWHINAARYGELVLQRGAGKQKLFCWVDVNTLDENNSLQDVLRRGFDVPINGMTFPFGCLTLPGMPFLSFNEIQEMQDVFPIGERRTFQLLLCEVGMYCTFHIDLMFVVVGLALPGKKSIKSVPEFDSVVRTRFTPDTTPGSPNMKTRNFTMHFPVGGPMIGSRAAVGVVPPIMIAEDYTIFDSSQVG